MKSLGQQLLHLRKEHGLTQQQVAQEVNAFFTSDIKKPVTNKTVSHWEHGLYDPPVQQFLFLCKLYGVADVLGTFWQSEITPIINEQGWQLVNAVRQAVEKSGLYTPPRRRRTIRLYETPASAGTGEFLDNGQYEMVDVGDDVPQSADFGLPITGDSMEPHYQSGQTAWVHKQEVLENGEIGVFSLNGESYIKELEKIRGRVRLISHNDDYAPIKVTEADNLKVFGKVVAATWLE